MSDEKYDAVFAGRFDLELDAELLHVEIRCRGHGQERPLAQEPDVGQPLLPTTVFSGPARRTVALVTGTHRHARRPIRAVVSVCVTSVVPVRAHRTIPPIVAHAPEKKIIISLDTLAATVNGVGCDSGAVPGIKRRKGMNQKLALTCIWGGGG